MKDKKSLNQILEDYQKIENILITNDGVIDESLEKLLSINESELENKLDGYEHFVRYLKSKIDYLKSMEDHYNKRRKTLENSIIRCRKSMTQALIMTDKTKVKTRDFNFSIGKSNKWSIDINGLSDENKSELINQELAENIFKVNISKLKAFYADNLSEEKPEWIMIDESEFIKVR